MSRFTLTATAVAVAAAVVGLAFALSRPASQTGAQTPATASPSDFAGNTAVGELTSGKTYRASTFSVPYSFTVPPQPRSLFVGVLMHGDALDAAHAMRIQPGQGAVTFHDGVGLPSNLCHPDQGGVLTRLPATPQGVGDWLAATKGLTISRLPNITVDGRTALSWDIAVAASCYSGDSPTSEPIVWFQAGEHHRLYAIPTGSGTILVATWGAGYQGGGESVLSVVNAWSDLLVKSLRFG